MADASETTNISDAIEQLLDSVGSVCLATTNQAGKAENSYTPYIVADGIFYIFVSDLAPHTANLKLTRQTSLLLIEDEATCKNLFARQRLILDCQASIIDRKEDRWETMMQQFEAKHGNTVALLRGLNDFHLFELKVDGGSFVRGFGQAYRFSAFDYQHAEQLKGK